MSHANRFDTVHEFSPEESRWRQVKFPNSGSENRPLPFARHSAVAIEDRYIVTYGGFDGVDTYFGPQMFDLETEKWSVLHPTGPTPPPRTNHTAVAIGRKIYVWGGITTAELIDIGDMWILDLTDLEAPSWHEVNQLGDLPPPRCGHTMFAIGNKLYLFGGGALENWHLKFSDVRVFDPETCVWSIQQTVGDIDPLIFPFAAKAGPFVFFGFGIGPKKYETVQNKLFVLDTVSWSWHQLRYTNSTGHGPWPIEKSMGTAALIGNVLFFFGGSDNWVRPIEDFESVKLPWPVNWLDGWP